MLIKIKKNIFREFFYFLTATLLLLILAEIIWPSSILVYLNINYVVTLWAFFWLLLI